MYSSQIQDTNIFKVNNVSLKHKYRAHAVWCLSSRSRIEQCYKDFNSWAVVVAQLVERLLLIPVISKNLYILNICLLSTVYWKDENKEKEAENDPFLKKDFNNFVFGWHQNVCSWCLARGDSLVIQDSDTWTMLGQCDMIGCTSVVIFKLHSIALLEAFIASNFYRLQPSIWLNLH